jgi:hypothetical protein
VKWLYEENRVRERRTHGIVDQQRITATAKDDEQYMRPCSDFHSESNDTSKIVNTNFIFMGYNYLIYYAISLNYIYR